MIQQNIRQNGHIVTLLAGTMMGIVLTVFFLSPLLQNNRVYMEKEKYMKDKLAKRDKEVEKELKGFLKRNSSMTTEQIEYSVNRVLDGSSL